MARLNPVARVVLNRRASKKLIQAYISGEIDWNHTSLKEMKYKIRILLRKEQAETCPYCQRTILIERRNAAEDIEHFLDKSRAHYRKYAFVSTNILLSCHPCNLEKGTKDLGSPAIRSSNYLPTSAYGFDWPHPYYDDMKACIEKLPGPVYRPVPGSTREVQAGKMIADLKLDTIQSIESRHQMLTRKLAKIPRVIQYSISSNYRNREGLVKRLMELQTRILAELY